MPEYLKARDRAYQRKHERELLALLVFGGFIAAFAVFGFARFVLWMVEKGWIN